jgi:hypothetical protein
MMDSSTIVGVVGWIALALSYAWAVCKLARPFHAAPTPARRTTGAKTVQALRQDDRATRTGPERSGVDRSRRAVGF